MKLLRTFVPTTWKSITELNDCEFLIHATELEYKHLKEKYESIWKDGKLKTLTTTIGYFTKSFPITLSFRFTDINNVRVAFYSVTSDIVYNSAIDDFLKVAYSKPTMITDALNFHDALEYIRSNKADDPSLGITSDILKSLSPEECERLATDLYSDYHWKYMIDIENPWEGHDLVAGERREDNSYLATFQIDFRSEGVSPVARVRMYKESLTTQMSIPDYLAVYTSLTKMKKV